MFNLIESTTLIVNQNQDMADLFGFKTKYQYLIEDQDDIEIGRVIETSVELGHFIPRQLFRDWKKFDFIFFDANSNKVMKGHHPHRYFLKELKITDHLDRPLGSIKQRFSLINKKYDIYGLNNRPLFTVNCSQFTDGAYEIKRKNKIEALIHNNEHCFGTKTFKIDYLDDELDPRERNLILATALYIDLSHSKKRI